MFSEAESEESACATAIDLELFCIVCLTPKEEDFDKILISSNNNNESKDLLSLGELYENVFDLEIKNLPSCPEYMCTDCSLQLKLFHKLKKKAIESYIFIKKNNLGSLKNEFEDGLYVNNINSTSEEIKGEEKQNYQDSIKLENFDENYETEDYESISLDEFGAKYIILTEPPDDNLEKNSDKSLIFSTDNNDMQMNIQQKNEYLVHQKGTPEHVEEDNLPNETIFPTIDTENNLLLPESLTDYSIQMINNEQKYILDESDIIETVTDEFEHHIDEYISQNINNAETEDLTNNFISEHKSNQLDYSFNNNEDDEDDDNYTIVESDKKLCYKQITLRLSKESNLSLYCKECNQNFQSKQLYTQHRRDNHPRVKLSCKICSKITFSEESHQVHMRSHAGLPAYECHMCDKTFKQKAHLVYHIQGHMNDLQSPCTLCPKKFRNKADLKIHMRSHLDERPYECDICKKRFRAHTHMTNHRYGHFAKSIECHLCHQKYSSPNTLRTHIKAVHEGLAPFECLICNKKFKRKHHLLCHSRTHEKNKLKGINLDSLLAQIQGTQTLSLLNDDLMEEECLIDEDYN